MMLTALCRLGLFLALASASFAADTASAVPRPTAPKPLYRDPVHDGAADAALVWNPQVGRWWMFYTNRRANVPGLPGVSWVHGTRLGIAESVDGGVTWTYVGTAEIELPPDCGETPTHWAPEIIRAPNGQWQMFLTVVDGVHEKWEGRSWIVQLQSSDLRTWREGRKLPLVSDWVLDASVAALPEGGWRLWYNDTKTGKSIRFADSPDLISWTDVGFAEGVARGCEGPKVFAWQGAHWMITDDWKGIAVYRSEDACRWVRQAGRNLLDEPGQGTDDQVKGGHADVVVNGDRAFAVYFTHPGRRGPDKDKDGYEQRRSSLQVVELFLRDGRLECDRNQPVAVDLGSPRTARLPGAMNPLLPGFYADPAHVLYQGKHYIYATLDPWGGETLGCWESDDFSNWSFRELNWPSKTQCRSAKSGNAAVWAPSVVQGRDGRFYMYVSVGNEVWVGGADHPLGPWRNLLGDQPLIPFDFKPGFHMIDAEAFIDDDGAAYLYWGSGWNWVNGRCFAARLGADMASLEGEVRDVTPTRYFEGPFMVKNNGRYYLTYSEGKTTTDTYEVRYAVGDTPFGPFIEGANSPILATDRSRDVISPGHHAVMTYQGKHYILYHRHSVPFDPEFIGRQVCVDELLFPKPGVIQNVMPTSGGPASLRLSGRSGAGMIAGVSSSSQLSPLHAAGFAIDDNYATLWRPAATDPAPSLTADLGSVRSFGAVELRVEYAWKHYSLSVEISDDGKRWLPWATLDATAPAGSPVRWTKPGVARFLRVSGVPAAGAERLALFEFSVTP